VFRGLESAQELLHFHVQKLASDATQEIRIGHRWEALQEETVYFPAL
jgi:hypothetical protein